VSPIRHPLFRDDHVCPWWLVYTFDNPLRRLLHDPSAVLEGLVREGMTAADIGCGRGYFTIALARMVGDGGAVIAVDVQQKMLDMMMKRANRAGVARRIRPALAVPDDIGIRGPVDFVLAFWMVHEVKDAARFFTQARSILKQQGKMLVAEPKMHVDKRRFREILQAARDAGFRDSAAPAVRLSRAVLLEGT
jgi:cyclopropane fatty-acyl-phospholipid synthase-like methyltransferase